jgi:hypothetical protein
MPIQQTLGKFSILRVSYQLIPQSFPQIERFSRAVLALVGLFHFVREFQISRLFFKRCNFLMHCLRETIEGSIGKHDHLLYSCEQSNCLYLMFF